MPRSFDYVLGDTASGSLAERRLKRSIENSAIATPSKRVNMNLPNKPVGTFTILFDANLLAGEKAILDAVVAAHNGAVRDRRDEMRLQSPDGSVWKITVDDAGVLQTVKV